MSDTATQVMHTPGPWELSEHKNSDGRCVVLANGIVLALVCARASSPASGRQYFEKDANARLIAAAPELLAALKHLVRYDFGDSEGAKEARAAIEKAETRS